MKVVLDTRSDLGIIVSQRPLIVGKSRYERDHERFMQIFISGNASKFDKARAEFIGKYCRGTITSGETRMIDKASQANKADDYPGPEKVSASVTWFVEPGGIRVTADVVDAYFSTKTRLTREWEASCVEVFLCPNGVDGHITQLFIVPEGPENAPRMRMIRGAKYPMDTSGVVASWKRTEKGYKVDALIPWSKLKGCKSSYTTMPVEIAIDSNVPDWPVQCRMNSSPDCSGSVRGYALLKIK